MPTEQQLRQHEQQLQQQQQPRYAPPASPPPREPLFKSSVDLPSGYKINLDKLASHGWDTLDITDSPSDPLHSAFSELFEASAQFFNLPEEERMKYRLPSTIAPGKLSEEGYSYVNGEKRMITLRKGTTTPHEFGLNEKAERAWKASGVVMRAVLQAIEQSLGMTEGVLVRLSERQLEMPESWGGEGGNIASLMRMFRYERPPSRQDGDADAGDASADDTSHRVVAEPHKDLGLLTIVVGHSPGLECWDPDSSAWVSCETKPGLNASIMTGQQLVKFTNGRYVAGRHRVFVNPNPNPTPNASTGVNADTDTNVNASAHDLLSSPQHRFSLVHALRGHYPVLVSSSSFETRITGRFPAQQRFTDVTIEAIYKAISDAHWNVNISVAERRKQERRLREKAERERRERVEREKVEREKVERERVEREEAERAEREKNENKNGKGEGGGEESEKTTTAKAKGKKPNRRFSKLINLFRRTPRQPGAIAATAAVN